MPDNFHPADPHNPLADYGPEQLYAYLAKHGVAKPEDATFAYSNLGVGLLGQALAVRAGRSYADQLREEITGPLGLTDTVVKLSAEQQRRFMQGYDYKHRPVHAWDLDALAGAGAIRSTAGDMLTYLEANLHPEKYAALSGAFGLSHQLRESASQRSLWRGCIMALIMEPTGMAAQRPGSPAMSSSIRGRTVRRWFS